MKSYAHDRERYGPMAYIVQAAPRRSSDGLAWLPVLKMAVALAALFAAGGVFLKLIGALP